MTMLTLIVLFAIIDLTKGYCKGNTLSRLGIRDPIVKYPTITALFDFKILIAGTKNAYTSVRNNDVLIYQMSSPIKGSASALGVYISGEIKPLCNRDIGSNEFFIDQTQDALDAEELKAQGKLLRIVSGDRSGSGCFTVEEYIDSDVYIPVVSADAKPEAKNIPELSDDIDKKISDCVKQLLDLATQKSEASQTSSDLESKRQQVSTKDAPQAFGPYSQAIKANGFVFISGCLGMDPVTMKLKGDTVETQTIQALENLKAILAASDCSLENVCKTTILLRDMSSYAVVNKLYATYFSGKAPPARTTFAVLELPAQALVEIDAIAVL